MRIELWYDETSDSDNPVWCVSLCEDDGEEVECLAHYKSKSKARAKAESAAESRGLELYER